MDAFSAGALSLCCRLNVRKTGSKDVWRNPEIVADLIDWTLGVISQQRSCSHRWQKYNDRQGDDLLHELLRRHWRCWFAGVGSAQQRNKFAQLLVVAQPQQLAAAAVVFRCELVAIESQAAAIVHQAGE